MCPTTSTPTPPSWVSRAGRLAAAQLVASTAKLVAGTAQLCGARLPAGWRCCGGAGELPRLQPCIACPAAWLANKARACPLTCPAFCQPVPPLLPAVAGLRDDGKMPSAFIADTTTANAQVGGCTPRKRCTRCHCCLTSLAMHTCCLTSLAACLPPDLCCHAHLLPVQVRSLGETVRLDARTKLLNPK